MDEKSLISIIVPVYNVKNYICKCIESIKNQTFKNFECIIVDDGSLDDSIDIAKNIVNNDERFIFVKQKNDGIGPARNYGLKFATTKYVAFLDSDDYWENNFLEVMLLNIKDADVCICAHNNIYNDNKIVLKNTSKQDGVYASEKLINNIIEMIEIYPYAWDKIYKKYLFDEVKFPKLLSEDLAVSYKILLSSSKIAFVNIPLYNYVQRSGSTMNTYSCKFLNDKEKITKELYNFLVKEKLYDKYTKEYENFYLIHVVNVGIVYISKHAPNYKTEISKFADNINKNIFNIKNIFRIYKKNKKSFLLLLAFKINLYIPKIILQISLINKNNTF